MINGKIYRAAHVGNEILVCAGKEDREEAERSGKKPRRCHVRLGLEDVDLVASVWTEIVKFSEDPVDKSDGDLIRIARDCDADVVAFGGSIQDSEHSFIDRAVSNKGEVTFRPKVRIRNGVSGRTYFFKIIGRDKWRLVEKYGTPYVAE